MAAVPGMSVSDERYQKILELVQSGNKDPKAWAALDLDNGEWEAFYERWQNSGTPGGTSASGASAETGNPIGSSASHNTPEQNDARSAAGDAAWSNMSQAERDAIGKYVSEHTSSDGEMRADAARRYGSTGRPMYAKPADPMQGAPQWIQDNQWAARHGSAMPGERNGGSGPAFQSRPQGRGASPYDRYAQSQVPTQRPVYNAVGTTTTMPPRASMPSAGMSQAYGAGTTTYIPARPAQTPVQRTGSQGVSQAGAQQRAAMAALTDLATPTQQAGAQAAAQGLQGVPGLERFRR